MHPSSRVPAAATATPNLAQMLANAAARHPGTIAIIESDEQCHYAALFDRANTIAGSLRQLGIQPNDRIAIMSERGSEAAAMFFGVLAAGGIAVNVNEGLRPRQIEYILRHAGARLLLLDCSVHPFHRALRSAAPVRDPRQLNGPRLAEIVPRTSSDVAQIVYTSGSTGQPKGVIVSHGNLWAGISSVASYLGIAQDDRVASLLPFSFDYGLSQLLMCVLTGGTLVVERSPLPVDIARTLTRQQVTVLPAVPPLWLQLLATAAFRKHALPSLRMMTNTGGRLPVSAVRALRDCQPQAQLFLMYGLTEAFRSTYLDPTEVDKRPESIGKAIPGAEVMVVRPDGHACDPGEEGELVHRGPTVALGYWQDAEATARVFRPAPRPASEPQDVETVVYSGDFVFSDSDGYLYFIGRRDRMIKTLGVRVSPDEVIGALFDSGEVTECLISTESDEIRGEAIIAHVVPRGPESLDRLRRFCRTELPNHLRPVRFEVHDTLPRTSSGKYDPASLA